MYRPARWPWLLLLLAGGIAQAHPGLVHRWTDDTGATRYGDSADAGAARGQVSTVPTRSEPAAVARLRLEPASEGYLAWVDNILAGPIEVMLHNASPTRIASDPPLPARATVPARQGVLVAVIAGGHGELRVQAVPGTPNARPRDVEYGYPLGTAPLRIQQAWGGRFSHADAENRHAVDFAAPVGTPVHAARDGVVMHTESGFADAAPEDGDATDRANFIRVLHDDGTMALYAHLQPGGVHVRVGQRVRRGQAIGLSGNTGRSTAPHLHFVVQANRGMRLESVPFRMFGPGGILRFDIAQGID
jgi:murein DD-endopeptidase MepM/ murein hydrolase activator NlpD